MDVYLYVRVYNDIYAIQLIAKLKATKMHGSA